MAAPKSLLLKIYLAATWLAWPALHMLSLVRIKTGRDDPDRASERFGVVRRHRPSGPVIWIHAASVGETMSVLPVIEKLCAEEYQVLLTTVTRTSAELASQRLPTQAIHQYCVFDSVPLIERFIAHWRPDLALTVESEIWPATFSTLKKYDIPLVLLNARMSDRSFKAWSRFGRAARDVFSMIDLALAQTQTDAVRLEQLGCKSVRRPGNLKFDAPLDAPDARALESLRKQIGQRRVWLAALTHPGEDEAVLRAQTLLLENHPDLLLILVPRHPARASDIVDLVETASLSCRRRAAEQSIGTDTQVYVADTIGEMALFYAVAPLVFLGGSFADVGGHNPLEAARSDTALLTGPKVENARAVYKLLWERQAAIRIEREGDLAEVVAGLLEDPGKGVKMARAAQALVDEGRGALDRTFDALAPFLQAAGHGAR
ncbi:3-deoxy-D-manno-octulosonic-acid transferase [Roseibium hamelinense]|uniref:3-deoxy-D-manno-octulosonic acid transferase n=2 Tax=Roseibium hamelinense TaxID=150831 RepID=A0A562T2R9_9HYPH|nr:3-deoxy-D-manno-octulosonic acid transferase [Roseibium hamelinense]TWI87608.1 3-deoxy-D-manno-octulosonic-acid transferase [Roseibium hamelinense]